MKSLYLLVNFFSVIIPLLFSFHPRIKFYKNWKAFFYASIPVSIIFIVWDVIFTHYGVWDFNPRYVTGIFLLKLPLEEMLFFICIPFSCVFTYYCFNRFYNLAWNKKVEFFFCIFFSLFLVVAAYIFKDKLYTFVTFISTAFICILLKFVCRVTWFGKAVSVYTILLIPFFVVNGILTGTGLEEPVVRYNDSENLGLRVFTIPLEDAFFGLELMLVYLLFYIRLEKKNEEGAEETNYRTVKMKNI